MLKVLSRLAQSYLFILLLAFAGGMLFSQQTVALNHYTTYFLAAIFFFSALKINWREVIGYLHEGKMILVVSAATLIVLPLVTFYVANYFLSSLAIPLMLLAAMPCGMATPLFAELAGGKPSLALILAVVTSLLAPFSVPLVIRLTVGAGVAVTELSSMFWTLLLVVAVPFVLAFIVRWFYTEEKIKKLYRPIKFFYSLFLGLLLMGIIASQADHLVQILAGRGISDLLVLFIFFLLLHLLGYYLVFWRGRADRLTVMVAFSYMNFTLAIYLADKFFNTPQILAPVILSVVPWSVLFLPLKYFSQKFPSLLSITRK